MLVNAYPVLGELNWISIGLRLFLAVLFGGIIGIDRGLKRRPAGLRTHMLVCMGAALVMITNQFITERFALSDPARLGAQVISGIGFLGAGTIIVTSHQQVKGLTTAAGLWVSACLGLATGTGFYEGAALSCILVIFIVMTMSGLDSRVISRSRVIELYVEMETDTPLSVLLTYIHNQLMRVNHLEIVPSRTPHTGGNAALVTVRTPKKQEHADIIAQLRQLEGVQFVNEV